jgi:hypothetical protein
MMAYSRQGEVSAPDFPWRCSVGTQGYDIIALIPLKTLAIDEGADRFMMEFSVSGSPVDVVHRERLFGSARPASTTQRYGQMNVLAAVGRP